jgi:peptidoglycan/xylan/chitin deacetylase (PgdA/CDA1 family)
MNRRDALPLVVLYHSISPYDEDPFQVTVSPQRFREQMEWLARRGLRGTSVAEVLAADGEGRSGGLVALTFDDGYADFAEHALPVLQEHGFSATLFALSGRPGGWNAWDAGGPRKTLLTEDELGAVAATGIEIGSHGSMHVRLPAVDDAQLHDEVVGSRERLRAVTGQEVGGFCYPWGDVSRRTTDVVAAAGYDYACAVWHSPLPSRYALPRTLFHDGDSGWRLDAKRLRHVLTRTGRLRLLRPRPPAPPQEESPRLVPGGSA